MVLSEFTGARAHKNDNLSRVRQEVRPLRPLGFNGNSKYRNVKYV